MAQIIGLKDLRENTQKYVDAAARGKSFVVVRRSKPIFRVEPVDEWGDEGTWKTLIDFTKIKKGGVPIREVIESLERLNAKDRQIHRTASSRLARAGRRSLAND